MVGEGGVARRHRCDNMYTLDRKVKFGCFNEEHRALVKKGKTRVCLSAVGLSLRNRKRGILTKLKVLSGRFQAVGGGGGIQCKKVENRCLQKLSL